jgi:hypothetical protein
MFKTLGPELLALFVALAFSTPSIASSCDHEIVVPIKFAPGKVEWAFRGKGTHFFGFFQKGRVSTSWALAVATCQWRLPLAIVQH